MQIILLLNKHLVLCIKSAQHNKAGHIPLTDISNQLVPVFKRKFANSNWLKLTLNHFQDMNINHLNCGYEYSNIKIVPSKMLHCFLWNCDTDLEDICV